LGLNAKKVPSSGGNRIEQPLIDVGGCPARVVQVIDLGLQPQSYQGEEKPPAREINLTYELTDEFCVDEEGNVQEDKPRWLSERLPLKNLKAEKAKSTLRYKAIDPTDKFDGDFSQLIGQPCVVNVVHNAGKGKNAGKVYNNVGSVSPIRPKDAEKLAPLVNKPVVFLVDEPDIEVFNSLPEFLQEIIKSNLEFQGSALQKALSGATPAKTALKTPKPDDDDGDGEGEEDWRD
jgi:hypothetical protein